MSDWTDTVCRIKKACGQTEEAHLLVLFFSFLDSGPKRIAPQYITASLLIILQDKVICNEQLR